MCVSVGMRGEAQGNVNVDDSLTNNTDLPVVVIRVWTMTKMYGWILRMEFNSYGFDWKVVCLQAVKIVASKSVKSTSRT